MVGFDLEIQTIPLDMLLPSKKVPDGAMSSRKFAQIKASMLNATPPEQLAENRPPKLKPAVTPEQMAKLEREMDKVQGQYQMVAQTYGADLLHLTVAKGYLSRLLANQGVKRYLNQHQPKILTEFEFIVETAAIEEAAVELMTEQESRANEAGKNVDETTAEPTPMTARPRGGLVIPFVEAA